MIKDIFQSISGVAIVSLWIVVVTATFGIVLTAATTNIIAWQ